MTRGVHREKSSKNVGQVNVSVTRQSNARFNNKNLTERSETALDSMEKLYWREILMILLLKIALIYGLWYVFYSHPVDQQLTEQSFSDYLLNSPNNQLPSRQPPGYN